MNIALKTFDELTPFELYEILKLRSEIFVVEQNCIYFDLDDLDQEALHLFAIDEKQIVGYMRLLRPGKRFPEASIGRVVAEEYLEDRIPHFEMKRESLK